jgi:CheY-like chemotaxis protein
MAERQTDLRGHRLLVVEDEYLVASDLAQALEDRGVQVVGPAGSIEEALALVALEDHIDGAVLDINLRGQLAYPVADALRARGVPFVFATGYEAWIIPVAYADVPRVDKPVDTRALTHLLAGGRSA